MKNNLTNISCKISKAGMNLWMVYSYLQYEKLWLESTKDGKKMNVLCIVDRNDERSVVELDFFRTFKGI